MKQWNQHEPRLNRIIVTDSFVVFSNVKPLIIKKRKHPKVEGERLKEKSLKNGSLNTQMVNNDNENYNLFHTKNQPQTLYIIQGMKSNTTINQINSIVQFYSNPHTNKFKFNSNIHEPISNPYPIPIQSKIQLRI